MEAPKTLRRPSNWQDFETLCKKLWGEIWNCPEIKKNGRTGQTQHGVDVYGIPFDEDKYYGIQCKGKDEYSNKQFTEDEIDAEIEKAKLFQPPLKKLYFATTAVKDAVIEEFVRKKNLENKAKKFFEVHVFSWEDIVDLIDENKHTHDWYVKSQNFKTNKSVSITFQNNSTELVIIPQFKRTITEYIQKIVLPETIYSDPFNALFNRANPIMVLSPMSETKTNLSYSSLYFQIHNTGLDPIEEFKMFFEFEDEIQDLKKSNKEHTGLAIIRPSRDISDIVLWTDPMSGKVVPQKSILVGDDNYNSDEFFLKPLPKEYDILIKWKLISKDFRDEGLLKLIVKPDISEKHKQVLVEDPMKAGAHMGEIEDVIVAKKD